MRRSFLNLYEIEVELKDKTFTAFRPVNPIDTALVNIVKYGLFKKYNQPVIFRNGLFLVYGKLGEGYVEIELRGDEERIIYLEKVGYEQLEGLENEEEVQSFITYLIKAHDIPKKFAREFVRENKSKIKWEIGNLILIPYLSNRVYKRRDKYLLQIDLRFRILVKENLQEILEEGLLLLSELETYRLKPVGYDFVSKAKEIKKANELGKDFILKMYGLTKREKIKKYWEAILTNRESYEKAYVVFLENGYVYPAGILHIVIEFDALKGKVAEEILNLVRLSPERRIKFIKKALKMYQYTLTPWGIRISNEEECADGKLKYNNTLVDSQGKTDKVETNLRAFLKHLTPFIKKGELRTFVLIVDKENNKQLSLNRQNFLKELVEFLEKRGIKIRIDKEEWIIARNRSKALRELVPLIANLKQLDLVLIFLEEYGKVDPYTEEVLLYDYLKKRLLEKMIPSQIVLNTTLRRKPSKGWEFIVLNVAEQIMAKTGNVPYKIKTGIEGADYFVGLDVSRITRGNTLNVGAFTKIFAKDGTFLKYKLISEKTFGESISRKAIQELFLTLKELEAEEGARIIIHRDGRFLKDEVESFRNFAKEFNYKLELLEIIKRGNPRIFAGDKKHMIKGDFYKLNENTLILATYNNVYRGTHQPLKLRKVFGELPIETLASQILSLTLMNYSSFQPIKLPATTHYSDKITKLLLRGIEPPQKEGDIMYWL